MSPLLRWLILPFLLLSGFEIFVLGGAALEWFGLTDTNVFLNNRLFSSMGLFGNLVQWILIINTILFVNFIALAVPLYFIWRDFKAALTRFHIVLNPAELSSEKESQYLEAAHRIFTQDPETVIYIYGHTHFPSLRQVDGRAVINTGTWLKRYDVVATRFGFLPAIYIPFYCLNYFRISDSNNAITIDYHTIDKAPPKDLTLLQRLLTFRRRRREPEPIPAHTVLEP